MRSLLPIGLQGTLVIGIVILLVYTTDGREQKLNERDIAPPLAVRENLIGNDPY